MRCLRETQLSIFLSIVASQRDSDCMSCKRDLIFRDILKHFLKEEKKVNTNSSESQGLRIHQSLRLSLVNLKNVDLKIARRGIHNFHISIFICLFFLSKFFFNCYLGTTQPTLGHSRGNSLPNPMLIIASVQFRPEGHQELRKEVGSLSPAERLVGFEPSDFNCNALSY